MIGPMDFGICDFSLGHVEVGWNGLGRLDLQSLVCRGELGGWGCVSLLGTGLGQEPGAIELGRGGPVLGSVVKSDSQFTFLLSWGGCLSPCWAWGRGDSIFSTFLSVSFLSSVLHPGAVIPHLESQAHVKVFSCVVSCLNWSFWGQGGGESRKSYATILLTTLISS